MTIALICVIATAVITCLSIVFEKNKQINELHSQLDKLQNENRLHNSEIYETHKQEQKRRDITEIILLTNKQIKDCEKIYTLLVDSGLYLQFYNTNSKKEKLKILNQLKK